VVFNKYKIFQLVLTSHEWAAGREPSPSEAGVDSQSVETATMISTDVGYDAGKNINGRKRHSVIIANPYIDLNPYL
jgi:hypothetical protein